MDTSDILDRMEPIRKRPAMYIGGTDINSRHQMLYEVLDNALEQAIAGRCNTVTINLQPDDAVTVEDNGPGIPVIYDEERGCTSFDFIFTHMHLPKDWSPSVKINGGFHGVGLNTINALSERLTAESRYNGQHVQQTFERGVPVTDLISIGTLPPDEPTGTTITFKPDPEIFPSTSFNIEIVQQRLRLLAYLIPGLEIIVRDERTGAVSEKVFHSHDGLAGYLPSLIGDLRTISPIFTTTCAIRSHSTFVSTPFSVEVTCALQFTEQDQPHLEVYMNTIRCTGTSEIVRSGIYNGISHGFYDTDSGSPLKLVDELPRGLHIVIAIKHTDPQFKSATKPIILNPEVELILTMAINEAIRVPAFKWHRNNEIQDIFANIKAYIFESPEHRNSHMN